MEEMNLIFNSYRYVIQRYVLTVKYNTTDEMVSQHNDSKVISGGAV